MFQCTVPPRDRLRPGSDAAPSCSSSPVRCSPALRRESHGPARGGGGSRLHRQRGVFDRVATLPRRRGASGEGELRGGAGYAGVREQRSVSVCRRTGSVAELVASARGMKSLWPKKSERNCVSRDDGVLTVAQRETTVAPTNV